jgi:hypothetical protein
MNFERLNPLTGETARTAIAVPAGDMGAIAHRFRQTRRRRRDRRLLGQGAGPRMEVRASLLVAAENYVGVLV